VVSKRISAAAAERELAEPVLQEARAADSRLAASIERELAAKYRALPAPKISPALAAKLKPNNSKEL
jgi:hypothetical protein